MKVLICGSRSLGKNKAMTELIESLPKGTVVIAGGANGADKLAEQAARARGLEVEVYKADWDLHGKSAGFIRNRQMLEVSTSVRTIST